MPATNRPVPEPKPHLGGRAGRGGVTPSPEFGVGVAFAGVRVVVDVRGDLDGATGRDLGALVTALIGRGHHHLVLDMAECGFADVAGLRIVVDASTTLAAAGGSLGIRSPSGAVRRLIGLTRDPAVAALVDAAPPPRRPSTAMPLAPVRAAPKRQLPLVTYLRKVEAIPTDDYIVDAALRLVMTLAVATVAGADGASVSLRRRGRLSTVAASDHTVAAMDASQYATGEGPCVDASAEGRRFHTASLAAEARWPVFVPTARALGISAILSSPLTGNGKPVGALNIYSRHAGAFGPADQQLAAVFASEASTLLSAAAGDMDEVVIGRLESALRTRHVIALAQGVLMERHAIDEDSAHRLLRRSSARTRRPVHQGATDIVVSTRPPRHTGPAPHPQ